MWRILESIYDIILDTNHFVVPVWGNTESSSFSHDKKKYQMIDTWGTSLDVYLGVYGNAFKRKFPWLFGTAYRDYGKTYYPVCSK